MTVAPSPDPRETGLVIVGRISGLYGVLGWLRVFSYTDPRDNIVSYKSWLIKTDESWRPAEVEAGRMQGKGVVVKLRGCDDRDAAAQLLGRDVAVRREQLGHPQPGEYFWTDLEGLRVVTTAGIDLGIVDHLFATGANDVIVVRGERERLIPFVRGEIVRNVELQGGFIEVDWDPEF